MVDGVGRLGRLEGLTGGRSGQDLRLAAELREVLVRGKHELVVVGELGLVGVALRRLEARERVGGAEVGVADERRRGRVVDVELDVARVPVGDEHRLHGADLLDHHVVVEDRVAVRGAVDEVEVLLVGQRHEVEVADELRRRRGGDVEDVDVVQLGVVDDDGVELAGVLPQEDRVRAVGHLGRVLGGVARAGLGIVGGLVARALDEGHRSGGVRHVVEVEAADAVRAARLVVDGQDVAAVEGHHVGALAVVGLRQRRHEGQLLRVRRVRDVGGEEPAAMAGVVRLDRLGPRVQVSRLLIDREVGDLTHFDRLVVLRRPERRRRVDLELADQLDVLADGRQVVVETAVLARERRAPTCQPRRRTPREAVVDPRCGVHRLSRRCAVRECAAGQREQQRCGCDRRSPQETGCEHPSSNFWDPSRAPRRPWRARTRG